MLRRRGAPGREAIVGRVLGGSSGGSGGSGSTNGVSGSSSSQSRGGVGTSSRNGSTTTNGMNVDEDEEHDGGAGTSIADSDTGIKLGPTGKQIEIPGLETNYIFMASKYLYSILNLFFCFVYLFSVL